MPIRISDDVIRQGVYAAGVTMTSSPEAVRLDFIIDTAPDDYLVVQRVYLSPSAVEPFYLELGALLERRREAEG